jgi:2'-5' RNA ligase
MLRLFVAVDLPAELREEVARMMAGVHHARWANPRQLHITLRFLGNTPEADLPGLQNRLAQVAQDSFHLRVRGAGVFPGLHEQKRRKPPKVVWLGLEPAEPVARLKAEVDAALAVDLAQEEKQEEKTFSPHLTLARLNALPDETLAEFLRKHAGYASEAWQVTSFHLYQSALRREGALHTRVASYQLRQPAPAE